MYGMQQQFLAKIEQYLSRTQMGPSYFGKRACGNSELVSRLREGKSVTLHTAEAVELFMRENPPNQEAAQ